LPISEQAIVGRTRAYVSLFWALWTWKNSPTSNPMYKFDF